ncbi:MAG: ribosome assembly factor SBDS [Thermoprotei archaeon]|nr:MAG: ribosome assembly factor SBDS [Thermoprotei archaeon]
MVLVREKREIIARLTVKDKNFEILVYDDKVWKYKEGRINDIREVLVGDIVYTNLRKGEKASQEELRKNFGTTDIYTIADEILKRGEIQITSEQRKKMIEEKKKRIIDFISKNCIDPRTKLPHPPLRIELALKQAKIGIDPFKPIEQQINSIIKELQKILPLKISKIIMGIVIPPQYVGKAYSYIYSSGKILRSNYLSDGSWSIELELPAGLQGKVIEDLNKLTKGNVRIRRVG